MVTRELEKKHRTEADFEREKRRCEETGDAFLNEEPETLQQLMNASGLGQLAPHGPPPQPPPKLQAESVADGEDADETGPVSIRLKSIDTKDGRRLDRLSQRQQAMRDAQELVDATEKIKEAANGLKELTFGSHAVTTPTSQKRRLATQSTHKRKRGISPLEAEEAGLARETSLVTEESGDEPEAKRVRLRLHSSDEDAAASPFASPTPDTLILQGARQGIKEKNNEEDDEDGEDEDEDEDEDDHQDAQEEKQPENRDDEDEVRSQEQTQDQDDDVSSAAASPAGGGEEASGTTVQVPLAPAGPTTPNTTKIYFKESSVPVSPKITCTTPTPASSPDISVPVQSPPQSNPKATAALSRSRRESIAPKVSSPIEPPVQPLKISKSSTPIPEPKSEPVVLRPRSARGHVPTPKAQSEEPKPNEGGRALRETRRHSVFSQPAFAEPGQPTATRASSRRKPPPKGEVSATEDGQKSVTRVKRAQGSKNRRKKRVEEEAEQAEDVDEDETRYCICDDISHGDMIYCDNNCEQQWFHLECMNMTESDLPPRRAKWYCPDCRAALGVDAYGNPLVPPSLPGRRGNRGWST